VRPAVHLPAARLYRAGWLGMTIREALRSTQPVARMITAADSTCHACSLNYGRLCSSQGWPSALIEFVALTESRRLACCVSYGLRSGRSRKRIYGAEQHNSSSSLPLVGIDSQLAGTVHKIALTCDDARTLKFTLIVQGMPN
jgi:hypothetical protein